MAKLTKRVVDAAETPGIIWDDELRGFGLRTFSGGAKSYVLSYRAGRGRNAPQHRITIGQHGALTPDQARREAKRLLGSIASGSDPAEARKAEARQMTLAALCDLYLAEGCGHKKPATIKADRARVRNHIVPTLGKLRIDRITRADVERMVRDVTAGKTAAPVPDKRPLGKLAQGGRGTAAQALAVLGAVLSFAVDRGLLDANPVRGVRKPPTRKMQRFLSAAELARLGEALDAEARASGPYGAAAIKLLIMTGARRGEILGLRWDMIDVHRAMIFLPDSKTGAKPIYLNAPALALLAELPRQHGNPFVICGARDGAALVGLDKVWARVTKAAALPGVRLHDLRHSFASVGAAGGNSLPIIGALLGHKHAMTTQRYAHVSADPVRAAGDAIAQRIAAALSGKSGGEDAGNVVPLPPSRAAS